MFKKDCRTSKIELKAAQNQLAQSQQQLENALNEVHRLRKNHSQCEQKLNRLPLQNRQSSHAPNNRKKPLTAQDPCQRYQELGKLNASLTEKIKTLKLDIRKRDVIIELQENVIKLLDDTKHTIETSLKDQIAKKIFEIETMEDRVKMVFKDTILFSPGSLKINENGKKVLRKIASSIQKNKGKYIRIEGHTDNTPANKPNLTNWDLSAARAIAVVRFLEEVGLNSSKLSAIAYGASRPVASNETEAGRMKNRRIEIVLYFP